MRAATYMYLRHLVGSQTVPALRTEASAFGVQRSNIEHAGYQRTYFNIFFEDLDYTGYPFADIDKNANFYAALYRVLQTGESLPHIIHASHGLHLILKFISCR